jgi:hypothetical protein
VSERVVKWLEDKRNVTNLLKLYSHGPEAEAMTQRVAELSFEDMASEWAQRPNEWRRAILKLCTKRIVVEPVGKLAGVTPKGFRFDPERVRIEFVV